jgi:hypothetical protein
LKVGKLFTEFRDYKEYREYVNIVRPHRRVDTAL